MLDLLSKLIGYLPVALAVIGALSLFVGTIAKLTATDKDDKIADFLTLLHDLLAKFALQPSLAVKKAGAAVLKGGAVVIDHRKP